MNATSIESGIASDTINPPRKLPSSNSSSAWIDAGRVTDPSQIPADADLDYTIQFSNSGGATTYDVVRKDGSLAISGAPYQDGKLIEFQIKNGTHGILVNGTTSEPSTLTIEERNRLVTLAIETTAGRVPVVAATGSQSFAESRFLTEHALAEGADSLLIVTPYYIRPPQRGLIAFYLELAAGHDVPWMVYHIPGRTAVSVTLDTLKALKDKSPHFVGIKQAVNDLGFVSECLHEFGKDFKVFVGLEELSFPMMAVGACGLMNAVGNLRPGVLSMSHGYGRNPGETSDPRRDGVNVNRLLHWEDDYDPHHGMPRMGALPVAVRSLSAA